MAQININGLDESKIWLHARRIDDKLVIVDQSGRTLGGVTNASIHIGTDDLTKIEISLNSASRKGDGEISMDFRG